MFSHKHGVPKLGEEGGPDLGKNPTFSRFLWLKRPLGAALRSDQKFDTNVKETSLEVSMSRSLLVSSSDCLDLLLILYLTNSTNSETAMLSTILGPSNKKTLTPSHYSFKSSQDLLSTD